MKLNMIVIFNILYMNTEHRLESSTLSHHKNMEKYWYKRLDWYIIINDNRTSHLPFNQEIKKELHNSVGFQKL